MEYHLCLCAKGIDRSPTAAEVARKIFLEKGLDIETSSDGFDDLDKKYENPREYLKKFVRFYVMEEYMRKGLISKYDIPNGDVVCLNIPDDYRRNNPKDKSDLENILETVLRAEIAFHLSFGKK